MSSDTFETVCEIWQNQVYWPISGWGISRGNVHHFTGVCLPLGSENLPNDISAPAGWEWTSEWSIDVLNLCGNPDMDGWYYAPTFDRLHDMIRNSSASGQSNKSSLVRKRKWIRSMVCTSKELISKIILQSKELEHLNESIKRQKVEKEVVVMKLKTYEQKRAYLFSNSLHIATETTLNTLSTIQNIETKLLSLKQYLVQRMDIDSTYQRQLEELVAQFSISQEVDSLNVLDVHTSTSHPSPKPSDPLASCSIFYNHANGLHASMIHNQKRAVSHIANHPVLQELNTTIEDTSVLLRDSRAAFRKNSDICRLSESAINNCLGSVMVAYDSVAVATEQEEKRIQDELRMLRGGVYAPTSFNFHGTFKTSKDTTAPSTEGLQQLEPPLMGMDTTTDQDGMDASISDSFPSRKDDSKGVSNPSAASTNPVNPPSLPVKPVSTLSNATSSFMAKSIYSLSQSIHAKNPIQPPDTTAQQTLPSTLPSTNQSASIQRSASISPISTSLTLKQASEDLTHPDSSPFQSEDLWLSIQRYRESVRSGIEALCALVSDAMDLELHQQILSNQCYAKHLMAIDVFNQTSHLSDHHHHPSFMATALSAMRECGVPFPLLRSPFDLIQDDLKPVVDYYNDVIADVYPFSNGVIRAIQSSRSLSSKSLDDDLGVFPVVPQDETAQEKPAAVMEEPIENIQEVETAKQMGMFSFTVLFKAVLPPCPPVVRSGHLFASSPEDFKKSRNVLFGAIWKTVYVVCTTDGFIHLLTGKKCEMPSKSFHLKDFETINSMKGLSNLEVYDTIIEVRPIISNSPSMKATNKSPKFKIKQDGVFLRASSAEEAASWIKTLQDYRRFEAKPDLDVEWEAKQVFLKCLPIILGKTAKVDLDVSKYQLTNESTVPDEEGSSSNAVHLDNNTGGREDIPDPVRSAKAVFHPTRLESTLESDDLMPSIGEESCDALDGVAGEMDDVRDEYNLKVVDATYHEEDELKSFSIEGEGEMGQQSSRDGQKSSNRRIQRDVSQSSHNDKKNVKTVPSALNFNKSLQGYGSQYTKTANAWIRQDSRSLSPPSQTSKQILPVVDKKNEPLAKRHSFMIKQYEEGLEKEKLRVSMKVLETKNRTLEELKSTDLQLHKLLQSSSESLLASHPGATSPVISQSVGVEGDTLEEFGSPEKSQ